MQPVVRLSLYLSVLAVTSTVAARFARPDQANTPPTMPTELLLDRAPCPSGTLEDHQICIPVPRDEGTERDALVAERNVHRTRAGNWTEYDQIPRQPDRPRDYALYRYPVQPLAAQSLMMSGYDLNLPNEIQRRGPRLKAVGHGGIDLAQRRGAEVHLVALEHQQGPAEVLFVGWLFGNTVVTLHRIRESGADRDYIVLYGHLERAATGLEVGAAADDGELLGYVGDSDSPGAVHLHLELRQLRIGVEARLLAPGELVNNARSVVCDPRNLFPLNSPE
ncbi:MAG TPA: M23 family metallopeptidase [Polyangiaceae bacterium]|nr:M23 family metallopeptidase [Polyangiaceae bacterium]